MRIPPSFYNALGRFLLFIAIEALCVVMILNNGVVQQYTLVEKIRSVQTLFWRVGADIKSYSKLKSINADVVKHNMELMEENEKLRNLLNAFHGNIRIDSLKSMLDTATSGFTYNWAKVVKNTLNTSHNFLIIDKGSNDGIEEDMGVITPIGAIGIVRAVEKNHSYVLSFLNTKQHVSAKLGKANAFGPLTWDGNSSKFATLSEVPQHIPVNRGDTIYTSGYSSLFPPNIPIGIADTSKIVNGMHRSVRVRLLQDFSLLDYVIVAKNQNVDEIENLHIKGIDTRDNE